MDFGAMSEANRTDISLRDVAIYSNSEAQSTVRRDPALRVQSSKREQAGVRKHLEGWTKRPIPRKVVRIDGKSLYLQ
jgi:hypothetical protein